MRFPKNADLQFGLVDQNVVTIAGWLWMVAVVLVLVFPGGCHERDTDGSTT